MQPGKHFCFPAWCYGHFRYYLQKRCSPPIGKKWLLASSFKLGANMGGLHLFWSGPLIMWRIYQITEYLTRQNGQLGNVSRTEVWTLGLGGSLEWVWVSPPGNSDVFQLIRKTTFKETFISSSIPIFRTSLNNNGIIWEFFPTWGGVFPIPKTKKKCP